MSSFPLSIFNKQGVLELKPTLFSVLIYQSYIHNKKLVVFNAEFYNRELYVFIHFLHKLWNQLTTFAFSELPDVFVGTCIPYLFFSSAKLDGVLCYFCSFICSSQHSLSLFHLPFVSQCVWGWWGAEKRTRACLIIQKSFFIPQGPPTLSLLDHTTRTVQEP